MHSLLMETLMLVSIMFFHGGKDFHPLKSIVGNDFDGKRRKRQHV